MPNESQKLLERLSKKANAISDVIERRQAVLDSNVTRLEKELFTLLQAELFGQLVFEDGKIVANPRNLLLLLRIDAVFERWQTLFAENVLRDFVGDLLVTAALTGEMYKGMATESLLNSITKDDEVLRAAIGIQANGNVVKGSLLYDISLVPQVRQDVKNVVLAAIKQGQTLRTFSNTLRDYVVSTPDADGRLKQYWRTYAYDLFNQTAEIKNEQFRRGLDLKWFLYIGTVIKKSRQFCIDKAGKVFAVVEADTEWPKDKNLIGKSSGIPYTPRIDRGRWNCRHRIRYITEETATTLDPDKVKLIKEKYARKLD